MYLCGENGARVIVYAIDPSTGRLHERQSLSTLPPDYEGRNAVAQIHMDAAGRFLYVANRGHNSLAGYAIDPHNGSLRPCGHFETEPNSRAFALDPSCRFLYAAGMDSNRIAAYRIDPNDGSLHATTTVDAGTRPMWALCV